jgi:outer membrane immunogenic protein
MNKVGLVCSVLLSVFVPTLQAGPEQYSGKEMKQVATTSPPECPSWTGFYIGGFGGYKFSNVDTDVDLTGLWDTVFPSGRDTIEGRQPRDLDNSGAEAGGLLGYNFQFGNWVIGGEAAGGHLWARDSRDIGLIRVPDDLLDAYELSNSFKTHYLVTVGPRIGYAFCRWMPYVTGGLAVGDLDYSWGLKNLGEPGLSIFSFRERGHVSETNVGWMVGGGLEHALTNHWHLRAQYQYIDLGSVDFNTAAVGAGSATDFTGRHETSLTEHNASLAVIYKF